MKSAAKRHFDRLLILQKLRAAAAPLAVSLAIFGIILFWLYDTNTVSARNNFAGVVESWTRDQTRTGTGALFMTVRLSDRRIITLHDKTRRTPAVGQVIRIEERVYDSGARYFVWSASGKAQ